MLSSARQHGRAEQVGIMNRRLKAPMVAEADTIRRAFARQFQDPLANAFSHAKILFLAGLLKAFQERLPDQAAPDNRWFVRRNPSTTARKIKVIPPAVLRIFRRFIGHE